MYYTEKIKNQSGRTSWTYGVIGKILSNTDYLGNDTYPKIISKQVFEHVAEKGVFATGVAKTIVMTFTFKDSWYAVNKNFCLQRTI